MRKPKLPRKPKAPKASAGKQTWLNYERRLREWKAKCTAKMKPYNEHQKTVARVKALAAKA